LRRKLLRSESFTAFRQPSNLGMESSVLFGVVGVGRVGASTTRCVYPGAGRRRQDSTERSEVAGNHTAYPHHPLGLPPAYAA